MSKNTINILCPNGHRQKRQMASNDTLLQVLEDICNQENLNSSEWGFTHQRSKCDLTIPWRMLNIPSNAVLEMYKLDIRRKTDDVNVQLQLPDNSRYPGWFEPTVTLQEMLDWYRIQPESMVAALDISISSNYNSCPVCSYMSEEIIGDYALSNTTLLELGLNSGTAVIRYNLRPVTDNELQKINGRIDDKLVRRRQQQYEKEQNAKQTSSSTKSSTAQPSQTTKSSTAQPTQTTKSSTAQPTQTKKSSTSQPSHTLMNTNVAPSASDEYSIFRDPPVNQSLPATTRPQSRSKTLSEELGLNISLDLETTQSQTDFRNFKFPSSTKGKNLYQNELDSEYERAQNVKPCDRHPIAYDQKKIPSTRNSRTTKPADVPDNFFELTADDIRSVLHNLQQQTSTENPLETREMRERAQSARTMSYEQIAIRFVVGTQYILQGLFRPGEPLSRLIEFARAHLICPQIGQIDFYLYTTPPRVILSDLRNPLSAYDLSPAAFVHLGHRTISPLNVQLGSNVPVRTIDDANQLAATYVFSRARPMSERENSALYRERPTSAATLTDRPVTRNPTISATDDKRLRDKFRFILPGKK